MRNAIIRAAAVAAVAIVLVSSAAFSPVVLRRMDGLNVQRVEVVGGHYLSAAEAVRASGITRTSNVFDDPAPWLAKLRAHPLVADARIERRIPATLVIHVSEAVPVAFARTPELRAIDERGRVLPADPSMDDMDLPVLDVATRLTAQGHAADAETRRIAAFLGTLMRNEPALVAWVSEVDVHGSAIRMVLRNATDADVLIDAAPTAARLRELHLTLADLAAPRVEAATDSTGVHTAEPDLSRVRRIDVRYHDQVVVALHGRKS